MSGIELDMSLKGTFSDKVYKRAPGKDKILASLSIVYQFISRVFLEVIKRGLLNHCEKEIFFILATITENPEIASTSHYTPYYLHTSIGSLI